MKKYFGLLPFAISTYQTGFRVLNSLRCGCLDSNNSPIDVRLTTNGFNNLIYILLSVGTILTLLGFVYFKSQIRFSRGLLIISLVLCVWNIIGLLEILL